MFFAHACPSFQLFLRRKKWLFPSRHCEKLEGVNLNEVWNTELRLTTSNFEQGVKEWPLLHFWKCEVIRFEGSIYSHQWSNFAQNEVNVLFKEIQIRHDQYHFSETNWLCFVHWNVVVSFAARCQENSRVTLNQ